MPHSHQTTGPVRFLARFLARTAEWGARRKSTPLLFSSIYGPHTAWHGCAFVVWSNNSLDSTMTPCDALTDVVPAPHGNLQNCSYPTGPVRGPCGTRNGAVWHPYWHVRELTQAEFADIPHGRRTWPHGARAAPLWSPHGLFKGCLLSLSPYGARKNIMHALKNCTGPVRRGKIRTAPHGARASPVSGRTIFVQNSPGTVRTGVWCDRGLTDNLTNGPFVIPNVLDYSWVSVALHLAQTAITSFAFPTIIWQQTNAGPFPSQVVIHILSALTPKMYQSFFTNMHGPINTLRPRHNSRNFAGDIFKCIFLNEFRLCFHWSLLMRFQLAIVRHWYRQCNNRDYFDETKVPIVTLSKKIKQSAGYSTWEQDTLKDQSQRLWWGAASVTPNTHHKGKS